MKKFWKKVPWPLRMMMLFAVLVLMFYIFSQGRLPFQKAVVSVKEQTTKQGDTIIKIEDKSSKKIAAELPETMTEDEVMTAIHQMSHQKVVAKRRWGAMPLTPERVNRLLDIVTANYQKYSHSDVYLSILQRWSKGDFSRIDHDHNAIWDLQGGTIGKAVGIASPEEEKNFIESHFKIAN